MPVDYNGNEITLSSYPYLECKEGRFHAFKRVGAYRYRENGQMFVVELRECRDCTAERLDFLDARREKVRQVYKHPDGYLMKYARDEEKFTRSDYAKALLKQATIYESREALERGVAGKSRR